MERIERIHALHRILTAARYPVTVQRLQEDLECSRATVYRDLAYLRDYLMAPVIGNGEAGFNYDHKEAQRFELPGLWLSSEELHALLASQHLLARTGGGVLSSVLAPLQQRIESLLAAQAGVSNWPVDRVRVIPHRGRKFDEGSFRSVASAVLERRQLAFEYRARSTDEPTKRTVEVEGHDDEVAAAIAELRAHSVTAETLDEARRWADEAVAALAPLPEGPVKLALTKFAEAVVDRTT